MIFIKHLNLLCHITSMLVEEQISDMLLTSGSIAAGSSAMSDKEIMLCPLCGRPAMDWLATDYAMVLVLI